MAQSSNHRILSVAVVETTAMFVPIPEDHVETRDECNKVNSTQRQSIARTQDRLIAENASSGFCMPETERNVEAVT